MVMAAAARCGVNGGASASGGGRIAFASALWFANTGISLLFKGFMSGLTLGLLSMGRVELQILQERSRCQVNLAATILPVVKKKHQVLVTLLLCNVAAMEALPLSLDKIFNPVAAVILSVTLILFFREVIPQAMCTRYGLAVGAKFVRLVRILMIICYPVAYSIGKILDRALGHADLALFRRAQFKALVYIHSKEAGNGGDLTCVETTIISGALDMTEKTAEEAMTPIESTFSLDGNSKLDWEVFSKILTHGHSRIPIYSGNSRNIIGFLLVVVNRLLLILLFLVLFSIRYACGTFFRLLQLGKFLLQVKSLLTVRAETETPVSVVSIRRIPRVPADMPLYDIQLSFRREEVM